MFPRVQGVPDSEGTGRTLTWPKTSTPGRVRSVRPRPDLGRTESLLLSLARKLSFLQVWRRLFQRHTTVHVTKGGVNKCDQKEANADKCLQKPAMKSWKRKQTRTNANKRLHHPRLGLHPALQSPYLCYHDQGISEA